MDDDTHREKVNMNICRRIEFKKKKKFRVKHIDLDCCVALLKCHANLAQARLGSIPGESLDTRAGMHAFATEPTYGFFSIFPTTADAAA